MLMMQEKNSLIVRKAYIISFFYESSEKDFRYGLQESG